MAKLTDSMLWFLVYVVSSLFLTLSVLVYLLVAPAILPRVADVVYSFD